MEEAGFKCCLFLSQLGLTFFKIVFRALLNFPAEFLFFYQHLLAFFFQRQTLFTVFTGLQLELNQLPSEILLQFLNFILKILFLLFSAQRFLLVDFNNTLIPGLDTLHVGVCGFFKKDFSLLHPF